VHVKTALLKLFVKVAGHHPGLKWNDVIWNTYYGALNCGWVTRSRVEHFF